VSFIKSRLRRAEQRARGGSCPKCGLPPHGNGRIVYDHIPEGAEELCAECGRPLWTIIKVVYDGDEDEDEDEGGGGYRWP
jgi:hypothetical protein